MHHSSGCGPSEICNAPETAVSGGARTPPEPPGQGTAYLEKVMVRRFPGDEHFLVSLERKAPKEFGCPDKVLIGL